MRDSLTNATITIPLLAKQVAYGLARIISVQSVGLALPLATGELTASSRCVHSCPGDDIVGNDDAPCTVGGSLLLLVGAAEYHA